MGQLSKDQIKFWQSSVPSRGGSGARGSDGNTPSRFPFFAVAAVLVVLFVILTFSSAEKHNHPSAQTNRGGAANDPAPSIAPAETVTVTQSFNADAISPSSDATGETTIVVQEAKRGLYDSTQPGGRVEESLASAASLFETERALANRAPLQAHTPVIVNGIVLNPNSDSVADNQLDNIWGVIVAVRPQTIAVQLQGGQIVEARSVSLDHSMVGQPVAIRRKPDGYDMAPSGWEKLRQ